MQFAPCLHTRIFPLHKQYLVYKQDKERSFPGGSATNAEDMGSIPVPGRSHIPWSVSIEPVLEPRNPRTHAQQEKLMHQN